MPLSRQPGHGLRFYTVLGGRVQSISTLSFRLLRRLPAHSPFEHLLVIVVPEAIFAVADVFHHLPVRPSLVGFLALPRPRKRLRVVEEKRNLQRILGGTPDAFRNAQSVRMGNSA